MLGIIYFLGFFLNFFLLYIEERKFLKPVWWIIIHEYKKKETWITFADRFLFVALSWFSYFIFGIQYYIQNWRK